MNQQVTTEKDLLLALDPGETTGWCLLNLEDCSIYDWGAEKYKLANWFNLLKDHLKPTTIVYERFSLYAHRAQQQINSTFYTVEMIGITKLYAQLTDTPIQEQTAAQGKQIWDDDKLQRFGYYRNNKHARDAIRHALTFAQAHRLPSIKERWNRETSSSIRQLS